MTAPVAAPRSAHAGTMEAADMMERLAGILQLHGQCDSRMLERARRVAAESGQRLDTVLIQLGLVTERGLAEAYAALLGLPLVAPDRYPRGAAVRRTG